MNHSLGYKFDFEIIVKEKKKEKVVQ